MASNRVGDASDRELGMGLPITRRDFVQGAAVGSAGLLAAAWLPGCGQRQPALPPGGAGSRRLLPAAPDRHARQSPRIVRECPRAARWAGAP